MRSSGGGEADERHLRPTVGGLRRTPMVDLIDSDRLEAIRKEDDVDDGELYWRSRGGPPAR
jgi:hypothetical protein